ncbi:MAG: hypothetical protein ACUZ8E_16595 [Candidatus Anammoxibacter sp.]
MHDEVGKYPMVDKVEDFVNQRSLLDNLAYGEAKSRISGLYKWLKSDEGTCEIVRKLEEETKTEELVEQAGRGTPPKVGTLKDVAGVGLLLMREIQEGAEPAALGRQCGIVPASGLQSLQDYLDSMLERFIAPALDYFERELQSIADNDTESLLAHSQNTPSLSYPLEIHESLNRFVRDHPDVRRNAFIMMQFGGTKLHSKIVDSIRESLTKYGITAHRADDKEYHDDLFGNVLTYLHGCSFGIAVFERLEADDFNPNVSLEVGYIRALGKSVCLLKDKTLTTLQTDLVGKLYKVFDPQDPAGTIPDELEKWLRDKDIVKI